MLDLEEQLRVLGGALDAEVPPVSADEARRLAADGTRPFRRVAPLRWPLAVAAAVLLVVGVTAVVVRGDDDPEVVTAEPGGYALDLDGHRDWMVALLNGDAVVDDATLAARFAPEFLEQVPPAEVRAIPTTLSGGVPWTLAAEVERRDDVLVSELHGADGSELRLTLMTDASRRLVAATVLATRQCDVLVPFEEASLDADPELRWAFDLVNGRRAVGDAELADHLSESFQALMSADDFRLRLTEVRAIGPFAPRWYEATPGAQRTALLVGTATGEEARLVVERDAAGKVSALSLTTQQPCALP